MSNKPTILIVQDQSVIVSGILLAIKNANDAEVITVSEAKERGISITEAPIEIKNYEIDYQVRVNTAHRHPGHRHDTSSYITGKKLGHKHKRK